MFHRQSRQVSQTEKKNIALIINPFINICSLLNEYVKQNKSKNIF